MQGTILGSTGLTVANSLSSVWAGVIAFLPKLIVALIVFIVGWIIASLLARAVDQILKTIKLDSALRGAGTEQTLARMGFSLNSGRFIGELVRWFIIVVFLIASLEIVNLTQVTGFLRDVVLGYLPQVIVAVLIMLVAIVLAEAVRKLVVASAKATHIKMAGFLGQLSRWAIMIFALLVALSQLGIGVAFLQTLFTGVVIALALAFGLAFGLGGQSAASRYLEHLSSEMKHD
jgi:hypothetical protein